MITKTVAAIALLLGTLSIAGCGKSNTGAVNKPSSYAAPPNKSEEPVGGKSSGDAAPKLEMPPP